MSIGAFFFVITLLGLNCDCFVVRTRIKDMLKDLFIVCEICNFIISFVL